VRKSWWIAGGAIVALSAIGLIGWAVLRHRRVPPKPPIAAEALRRSEILLAGTLQPQVTEQVDAPAAGILDGWFVEVGQEVYEDQLVGRIRNADRETAAQNAQVAVDRAEVRIAQLEAQASNVRLEVSRTAADQIRARNELDRIEKIYQRHKNLMDAGAIARLTFEKTQSDYNSAKAEASNRDAAAKDAQERAAALERDSADAKKILEEQTAALEKAKEAVAECDLHSPADGVVLARRVHQGEKVEESAEGLLTVATDLTKLQVAVTPEPSVLAAIHAGQKAFVENIEGTVEVRGTEVVVKFTSPTPATTFGTSAQVRIVL
jgi:multidrug resistance efflux pump